MPELALNGVSRQLGGRPVLDDITLTVPSGSRTSVVGASGSGKSTLLRLIAGFDAPDAGQITLDGRVFAGGSSMVPAHRRGVGYVAQDGALFPHLTVEQNIRFGLPRSKRNGSAVSDAATLARIDPSLFGRYPHELSGGQQQRVALARALAPRPLVVLLDEPFSALDTGLRESTRQAVIDGLEQARVTTILVTHDHREALSFGSQIALIEGGRIVQSGAPGAVFENPHNIETARFLGDAAFLPCTVRDGRAVTAIGLHAISHDHSAGHGAGIALVRPGQLSLDAGSATPNAEVVALRAVGSRVDVELLIAGGSSSVNAGFRAAECLGIAPGRRVGVGLRGGVVVYQA